MKNTTTALSKKKKMMTKKMPKSLVGAKRKAKSFKVSDVDSRILIAAGVVAVGAISFLVYRNREAILSSKAMDKIKDMIGSIRELLGESEESADHLDASALEQKTDSNGFFAADRTKTSRAALHKAERGGLV